MLEVLMRGFSRGAAALAVAVFLMTTLAFAQSEVKKSPFGVGPTPTVTAQATSEPQFGGGIWGWAMATQQRYSRDLASAVRDLKTANPMAAAATLAWISFAYGVLHAAGPGHGKAVISSYVLANRQTMRRGIFLSFLSAFFQACSAILLVGILALLVKATSIQMRSAESWIETISWALVALVGVWLLYRQVRPLIGGRGRAHDHQHSHAPTPSTVSATPHVHGPGCGHDHGHDHARPAIAAQALETAGSGHAHGPGCGHDHGSVAAVAGAPHVHGPGCGHGHAASAPAHVHDASCGHAHMPEPSQLEGPWSWPKAISLALTVGIRPCSGAILVLLFALSQGLLWAGIFATFVMSLGTALTVSALAALAVGSREVALRWAGPDSPWAARLQTGVGIAAAALVIGLGTAGFLASLRGPAPF
jgi:nickel/cobalt transporter (NicO) family protein